MILKPESVFSAIFITIALIVPSPTAGSAFAQIRPAASPAPAAQTEAEQKARKELEQKALALLDELIAESGALDLAENRVHVRLRAAEMLWTRDEARARALVREALDQVVALVQEAAAREAGHRGVPTPDGYGELHALRNRVVQSLASRDAKLALEFLRATRQPNPSSVNAPDYERQMETHLAMQAAASDPQMAIQLAEEMIGKGINHQTIELWGAVQRKDPRAGVRLANEIISQLTSEGVHSSHDRINTVFSMLHQLRSLAAEAASQPSNATGGSPRLNANEIQLALQDLLGLVVGAALKVSLSDLINPREADRARNLLSQMQQFLPDIEKYLPSQLAAARAKLKQFDQFFYHNPHQKFYDEFSQQMPIRSPQEMLAIAAKAPPDVRDSFHHQIMNKAAEQGDLETARKIAKETLKNNPYANQFLNDLERRAAERAFSEGKYDEARKLLIGLRSDEDRATVLMQWAATAAVKGDEQNARQFLEEARALMGDQMRTRAQLDRRIKFALVAVRLQPEISFGIAEAAIERLNRLVAAGAEMDAFDRGRDGELRMESGGAGRANSGNINQLLVALARQDFDRLVALLRQWQPAEVRLMMSLSTVQGILGQPGGARPYTMRRQNLLR